MSKKPKEPYQHAEGVRTFTFLTNPNLFNQIVDISNTRRRSLSSTVRMLLYLGLREWEICQIAGHTHKKYLDSEYHRRLLEAQAIAKRREEKDGESAMPATAYLYGLDMPE